MNAKEAREKTEQVFNDRLPTCISNVDFEIRQACLSGKNYITTYIPSEYYHAIESHFEGLGYQVTQYAPNKVWYKKSVIDNMRISW